MSNISKANYERLIQYQNASRYESKRLKKKQQALDEETQNLNRMTILQKGEEEKRFKYINLMTIIVVILLITFVMLYIQTVLKQRSVFFDFLLVLSVSMLLGYACLVYIDIGSRDLNDFSKLNKMSNILVDSSTTGTNTTTGTECIGSSCCKEDTPWSAVYNACL